MAQLIDDLILGAETIYYEWHVKRVGATGLQVHCCVQDEVCRCWIHQTVVVRIREAAPYWGARDRTAHPTQRMSNFVTHDAIEVGLIRRIGPVDKAPLIYRIRLKFSADEGSRIHEIDRAAVIVHRNPTCRWDSRAGDRGSG